MSEAKSWEEHKGEIIDSVKGFDIIKCQTCGFKHIIPIPTAEEMSGYYSEQFLKKRPLYIDRIREDLEWWRMVYAEQYDMFESNLTPERRCILDIGCGLGFFLQLGGERGWKTLGIEPSRQACEYAWGLGLDVVNDVLGEKQANGLGTFDVVHMHDVLEHVSDAVGMVGLCHKLIEPGGLFCVVVPNDYNPLQQVLRDHLGYEPWWVSSPEHINYFDFESLEHLLRSTGFDILLKTTTFPMELFLLMGDNYVGNQELGRGCHHRRTALETNLHLGGMDGAKRAFYVALAEQGIGREVVILAKKV